MVRRTLIALAAGVLVAADEPPTRVPADARTARREAVAEYGTARLLLARGRLPEAATHLEAAVRLDDRAAAPHRDLVRAYLDLGRDPAAVRSARKVLELDPADAETARTLARLLNDAKRPKEAADVLAGVLDSPRLANRPTLALSLRTELARYRAAATDPAGAAVAWAAVERFLKDRRDALIRNGFDPRELDREAAAAAEKHGLALADAKQFDAAAAAFARARVAGDPASVARSHWHTAQLLAAKGDPAAALPYLERFLGFAPSGPGPYRRYAELLHKAGRGEEAAAKLAPFAERPSKSPAAKWVLAAEQVRAGHPAGHGSFLELISGPADAELFRVMVQGYAAGNRPRELLILIDRLFPLPADAVGPKEPPVIPPAEADRRQWLAAAVAGETAFAPALLRAATDAPRTVRSADGWEVLGWVADRAGRPELTERALREAFRTADERSQFRTFQRLYWHLTRYRKWDDALVLCEQMAGRGRMAPGYVNYFRAVPLAELGRTEEAMAAASAAQADTRFEGLRQKARVLGMIGRYREMKAVCDALLAEFTDPSHVRAVRYVRADAFLGLRQFREAEEELRGVIAEDPDDALALNNLGYNLADQNRNLAEAEELIRRAVEADRDERARGGEPVADNAAYLDSLGWVRFRRGDLKQARELLERAAGLPDGSTDPTVWDHLGDVCFRLGDRPAARRAWQAAADRYVGTHTGRHQGRREEALRKRAAAE